MKNCSVNCYVWETDKKRRIRWPTVTSAEFQVDWKKIDRQNFHVEVYILEIQYFEIDANNCEISGISYFEQLFQDSA